MSYRVSPGLMSDSAVPSYSTINEFPLVASLNENTEPPPTYIDALNRKKLIETRSLPTNSTTLVNNQNNSNYESSISEIIAAEVERKLNERFPLRFSQIVLALLLVTCVLNQLCAWRDQDIMPVVLILTLTESGVGILSCLLILALSNLDF
jgi:hypothetical protein